MSEENKNMNEGPMADRERLEEEVTHSTEPATNNPQPETLNPQPSDMEVHKHPHHVTHKKKWGEYVLEFFMLFLAVFLGFIAENIREHYVEHQREKQYMRSMLKDLQQDTLQIMEAFKQMDEMLIPTMDSSLALLYVDDFSDSVVRRIYHIVPRTTQNFLISFQNKTETQLKNSGNLRLIEDQDMLDSMTNYWQIRDVLSISLFPGYEITRRAAKDLTFSLLRLDYYAYNSPWQPLLKDKSLQLLSDDRRQFKILGNLISNQRSQLDGPFRMVLTDAYYMAVSAMEMIHKKYHIE